MLISVALLALNDRVLKSATWFPDVLAGKASDVFGLFALPFVLVAVGEILTRKVLPWSYTAVASGLIAVLFALSKFESPAASFVEWVATMSLIPLRLIVGADTSSRVHFVRDLTDLVAVAGAVAAPAFVWNDERARRQR